MNLRHSQIALSALLSLVSCSGGALKIATLRGPSAIQMVQILDSLSRSQSPGISVSVYDEPLQLLEELSSGDVDFATLPVSMAPMMRDKGFSIAAVTIWGGLFLCGSDASAGQQDYASFDVNALRGKTVHTLSRGMAPDILLRHILDKNGLVPDKDVFFDYSFPTHAELVKAVVEGETSLCTLPEPLLSSSLISNPHLHIVSDLALEWMKVEHSPLPVTVLFCRDALSGGKMESSVTEALMRSSQWVNSHPQEAAALAYRYGISPDVRAVECSVPRSAFDVVPLEEARDALEQYLDRFSLANIHKK